MHFLSIALVAGLVSIASAQAGNRYDGQFETVPFGAEVVARQSVNLLSNTTHMYFQNGTIFTSDSEFKRHAQDGKVCILKYPSSNKDRIWAAGRALKTGDGSWIKMRSGGESTVLSFAMQPQMSIYCFIYQAQGPTFIGTRGDSSSEGITIAEVNRHFGGTLEIVLPNTAADPL